MLCVTCRGFHWFPKSYAGINGCTTKLWVWLWWSWEVQS